MQCEIYTDLIDSYLGGELRVETYHSMLWHADHCFSCRAEMQARMRLRHQLQRACLHIRVREQFLLRLRERLRAEAGSARGQAKL